jgi:hypothetical protein
MVDREVPLYVARKTAEKDVVLDPAGFFVIEVGKEGVRVEFFSNVYQGSRIVSGRLEAVFTGVRADALCDTIAGRVPVLLPVHYLYLGRELQRAQMAFEKKEGYVQGGC